MSDLIDRQAAIDVLSLGKEILSRVLDDKDIVGIDREKYSWGLRLIESNIEDVKELPSAQPEIIRCTECKHYREYDSKYVENAVVVQCMADRYPISETIPDGWFCAGAERKDDE